MTAEIVNLRRARKKKARADKAEKAQANRVSHGIGKKERLDAASIADFSVKRHEAHKRTVRKLPPDKACSKDTDDR
mgnify:CR=1 FL=1